MYAQALENEFARDVRAGLTTAGQKTLPCRYLYDDLGSALFEAITLLPEYGLTRADARVIEARAGDLLAMLPQNMMVAELGSGTGTKTRTILEHLRRRQCPSYYPIDVSATALARCGKEMGALADVTTLEMSYLDGLREVTARRAPGQTLLVLFLGSTIGNFEPDGAIDFLYAVHQVLAPGDALLLGTDLVKATKDLLDAYDDPTGVTASFNLNLLGRINRELDADFDLRRFAHVIRYHEEAQRIEMHLRSRVYQIVSVKKADLIVDFAAGETICTEACHKFHPEQVRTMARAAGFRLAEQWVDEEWLFAENLLIA
uniref:Histidine-specific methyltransferase SAM-dependent domain-containing protein n=1 Tax=Solibacter usitatus (strain Ellin6076) TaxID=234267 RepID=Q020E2_SOLUE